MHCAQQYPDVTLHEFEVYNDDLYKEVRIDLTKGA